MTGILPHRLETGLPPHPPPASAAAFPGTTGRWDDDALVFTCPVGVPEVGPEDLLAALVS